MHQVAKALFLSFSIAFIGSCSTDLSEESVRQVISNIDDSITFLNADGIGEIMSDDVEIVIHIFTQGQVLSNMK